MNAFKNAPFKPLRMRPAKNVNYAITTVQSVSSPQKIAQFVIEQVSTFPIWWREPAV